jgi:tRNA(adenine34) deaminase
MELPETTDAKMMRRCFDLARLARMRGEAPYAAVISRQGTFLCETGNRAAADRDATRHAELVAVCEAERKLGSTNLDECTLYSIVEPCPMCAYAIRETRIGRVVYSLSSPVMGGHSRWNILCDEYLSDAMPEVFAPSPVVVAGYMSEEAANVMHGWNPLFWQIIRDRRLILKDSEQRFEGPAIKSDGLKGAAANWFRTRIVDRIWRS